MSTSPQSYIDAALGWLELGNWREADAELDRLPPELRATSAVLKVRLRIYAAAERWHDVELIAAGCAATSPNEPRFHTWHAWALHRQGRTEDGLAVLMAVVERFPEHSDIPYTIACLSGALGRVEEVEKWLPLAFERASDPDKVKLQALDQPELLCLWQAADRELGPDD